MSVSMRGHAILSAAFVAAILRLTSPAPAAGAEESVTVGGTGTALGTARMLGDAFEIANPGAMIKVLPSLGSGGAIKALSKNALDVGLISRPLTDQEKTLGLVGFDLARTPLIVVAHKGVIASDMTTAQLRSILLGETQKWSDGLQIRPILRANLETDTMIVKQLSTELAAAYDAALARPGMLVAMTDQECLEMVSNTPGSFGFSTLTQVQTEDPRVKTLSFNGRTPTVQGLRDGSYPLSKPISILTQPKPSAGTLRFLAFLRSPTGRKIIEGYGNLLVVPASGK